MDALVTALPPPSSWEPESGEEAPPLAVAIVGRPNVGEWGRGEGGLGGRGGEGGQAGVQGGLRG
jgi:hypothetical protein